MKVKDKKGLVLFSLLYGVNLAYASPIKDSEILKHHRGVQILKHTPCTKVSKNETTIKRHRGLNSIGVCCNTLIRENIGENVLRHRGEQKI